MTIEIQLNGGEGTEVYMAEVCLYQSPVVMMQKMVLEISQGPFKNDEFGEHSKTE